MAEPDAPPPATPDAPLPAKRDVPLDRKAVERVLARAAELQAAVGGADSAELISGAQLVEIAREVGLEPAYIRQALAEEQTRLVVPHDEGWLARTFGPARIGAGRSVAGSAADLLAALDRWMQREECLRVQRRFPDRIVWEPRADVWGMVRRGLGVGGRSYELAKAYSVSATVVALDAGRTLVALEADVSESRATKLRTAIVIAGAGAVVAATGVGLEFTVPAAGLLPLAGGSGLGWAIARRHRGFAAKVQLALEQTLDRLEYGEAKPPRTLASAIEAAARPLLR